MVSMNRWVCHLALNPPTRRCLQAFRRDCGGNAWVQGRCVCASPRRYEKGVIWSSEVRGSVYVKSCWDRQQCCMKNIIRTPSFISVRRGNSAENSRSSGKKVESGSSFVTSGITLSCLANQHMQVHIPGRWLYNKNSIILLFTSFYLINLFYWIGYLIYGLCLLCTSVLFYVFTLLRMLCHFTMQLYATPEPKTIFSSGTIKYILSYLENNCYSDNLNPSSL